MLRTKLHALKLVDVGQERLDDARTDAEIANLRLSEERRQGEVARRRRAVVCCGAGDT